MFISWKLINGLNKIEKRISLSVKFKKLNYFSAAKENLFILQLILYQRAI